MSFGFGTDPSVNRAGTGGTQRSGNSGQVSTGFSFTDFPVLDTLSVLSQVGSTALAFEQAEDAEKRREERRKRLQKQRNERRKQIQRQQAEERRRRKNEAESTAGRANRTRGRDLLLGNRDENDESMTETLG